MKNTLLTLTSLLALAAAAHAGSNDYVSTSSNSQMASSPLYRWFAGASVGYLTDSEDAYYTIHAGMKIAQTGPISHSLFIEGGYASVENTPFIDEHIVPVTLNYKLDYYFTDRFSVYAGAGAGAAFVHAKTFFGSDDDTSFTAQAFTGVGYDITPTFQVYGGARYIWIDDSKVLGTKLDTGNDVGIELGARFRF